MMIDPESELPELSLPDSQRPPPHRDAPASPPQRHPLSDTDRQLLARIAAGETTFRPASIGQGESIETLVSHLGDLRDRGLVALSDSRIMRSEDGRALGAGPCSLTPAGRAALEHDGGSAPAHDQSRSAP